MKPLGLALGFVGYTLIYFGYCSLRGPGVGLVDLIIPARNPTFGPGAPGNLSNAPAGVFGNYAKKAA